MSPAAIHPVPSPNGKGKGGIYFYYYPRPWICFFPTRNPRQLHPTVNSCPQHSFWWCLCLHMFTYPCLTQIYPLHALPSYLAPMASKIPLPALKHPYLPVLIYPTLPIGVTHCYIWLLGNLLGRLLPLYKYALSWQTRDISYIILAYKADFTAYCDACPKGLGYWFPASSLGFCAPTPKDPPTSTIFYFEALCVLCALQDISTRAELYSRVAIYTDNQTTVQIFNSLACLPIYNHILCCSADILITNELDLRVLHVPGDLNAIADALPWCQFAWALDFVPELKISPFQPPRWMLGAAQKWSPHPLLDQGNVNTSVGLSSIFVTNAL